MDTTNILGVAGIAAITILCLFVGLVWKTSSKLDNKWIPVVCCGVGIALGLAEYFMGIGELANADPFYAAAAGFVSGAAATGVNQIKKQLFED